MESGRRSGDRAPDSGIESLISLGIDRFRFPVQVWRNGYRPAALEYGRERRTVRPGEGHGSGLPVPVHQAGFQVHTGYFVPQIGIIQVQDVVFPPFRIPDHTLPGTLAFRSERQVVVDRIDRLEAEYFDMRPALALEMQPSRYNLRIVEYHQRVLGKERRKISEYRFSDNSVLIMQEFRRVALGKRIFRNPLGRQRIIVIIDSYTGYHGIS